MGKHGAIAEFITEQADRAGNGQEGELRRRIRTLRSLYESGRVMMHAADQASLLHAICRCICETGGFRMAWVGFPDPHAADIIKPIAWDGYEDGFLEARSVLCAEMPSDDDPTIRAYHSSAPQVLDNIQADPLFSRWRMEALQRGYASALALPFHASKNSLGVLTIFASTPHAFNDEEILLLRTLADDLSDGLLTLRAATKARKAEQALAAVQARLRHLVSVSPVVIYSSDASEPYRLTFISDNIGAMVGYSPKEILAYPSFWIEHIHTEDVDRLAAEFSTACTCGHATFEYRVRHRDGGYRWIRDELQLVCDDEGNPVEIAGSLINISDTKKVEDRLRLAAMVIENTVEGVIITDADSVIQTVNQAFTTITGYSADEVIGKKPNILRSDRHDIHFYRDMWRSLLETGQWEGEIWNRRKNGEAYPEWLSISSILDAQGNTTQYVAIFNDITESKRAEAQIKHQAYHDALTGLPNRLLFNDRLAMALAHARRNTHPLAVMFLDLDRFKEINDSLGHIIGDMLLQRVADRLTGCVRSEDTVARMGGDEFTLVLPNISKSEDAVLVARKILDALKEPFTIEGHEFFVTSSIGFSVYPTDGDQPEVLMKNADTALYRAKELGRNNYQPYAPAMNARAIERLKLETGIRKAVERDQMLLHYQPRFDLYTGEITGVEALLRWQHPEWGLVPTVEFITLVEETGLIVPIGEWALRAACRQNRAWQRAGLPGIRVAVNISARQFQQKNLVAMIFQVLQDTGLSPESLELEITEGSAMENMSCSLAILRELHMAGIQLSLDDFGTGYSSLGALNKLPVHALKIDKSFISSLSNDHNSMAIATAMIGLAHTLDLAVIAEGVETEAQLHFLRSFHCDEGQGYYFSRPLPPEEFEKLYLASHPAKPEATLGSNPVV